MAVVTYNGVEIKRARITGFSASPRYDRSGIVGAVIDYSATVRGLVVVGDGGGATLAEDIPAIVALIGQPRKSLVIQLSQDGVTPVTMFSITGGPAVTTGDASLGPFPENLQVDEFVGSRAAIVSFTIRWSTPISGSPVITSHRYETRYAVDSIGHATRQVVGYVSFSSRVASVNPDVWRCFFTPPEIAGFKREGVSFAIDASGLSLVYQVTDTEVPYTLPRGIMQASGSFQLSVKGGEAGRTGLKAAGATTASISFRLEADRYLPKKDLIDAAWAVLDSRFALTTTGSTFFHTLDIAEPLWTQNAIEVTAQALVVASVNQLDLGRLKFGAPLPTTLAGSQGKFRPLSAYGASLVYAASQAIFNPVTDGNPATQADTAKATASRYDRSSMVDLDGDGLVDSICTSGLPATGVELPPDLPAFELFRALSSEESGQTPAQTSANPYTVATETFELSIINGNVILSVADNTQEDRTVEASSPKVVYTYAGKLSRLGAPPQIPVPPELGATGYVLRNHTVSPLPARAGVDGRLIYTTAYRYEIQRPYDPSSGFGVYTVGGTQFRRFDAINNGVPVPDGVDVESSKTVPYANTPSLL